MRTSTRRATQVSGMVALVAVAGLLLASPASAVSHRDTDHDGMPNSWERGHGLNWKVANGRADADRDGLSNLKEFVLRTDPRDRDSNDDGEVDGLEDADHDGVDNEDDADEFCAATAATGTQVAQGDDDQGENCEDHGDSQEDQQDD